MYIADPQIILCKSGQGGTRKLFLFFKKKKGSFQMAKSRQAELDQASQTDDSINSLTWRKLTNKIELSDSNEDKVLFV